jgi:hypothetical protein
LPQAYQTGAHHPNAVAPRQRSCSGDHRSEFATGRIEIRNISESRWTCLTPRNRHIRLVGQPVTLSRRPTSMAARPPEFGEQTDEVLTEFGFAADETAH